MRTIGLLFLATLFLSLTTAANKPAGGVRCQIWNNLDGGQISDTLADGVLNVKPSETRMLEDLELNPGPEIPMAGVVQGFLTPPATGDYVFVISGDDSALLYLSTDASPGNRKIIATVPSYTGVRDYQHFVAQTSKPIKLQANKRYYIEAWMKNEQGSSHVSVGWTLPDKTVEAPIPGTRLTPATGTILPPTFQTEPPKLTIANPTNDELKPGFHKFPSGAHVEFPDEKLDFSYETYVPNTFDTTHDKRPLFIFLHGNSHQGMDLAGIENEGPAAYLNEKADLRAWFPMIALFPQLPPDWRWDRPGAPAMVNALIQQICVKYPRVDRNRIYLSGLSMGGKGTWLTVLDSPKTFAAIATISAVAVRPAVAKIKLAGIRNIHILCGGDDGDFCNGSKLMYETLKPVLGNHVQLTVFPNEGHGIWYHCYPERAFYEELMRNSK